MTVSEFSNQFDTFLSSYSVIPSFGRESAVSDIVFDEYEKSLFLTEAQNQIVVELYTGRNEGQASFEVTEELRTYLRNLIKSATLEEQINVRSNLKAQSFELPSDLLFIIYEEAIIQDDNAGCFNGSTIQVTPTTWDSLHRTMSNPFRKPNQRRALRLDCGSSIVEVISDYDIGQYKIKYLSRPKPIILVDLDNTTIEGINTITECELDPIIHGRILERAIQLAIRSRGTSDK